MSGLTGPLQIGDGNIMYVNDGPARHHCGHQHHLAAAAAGCRRTAPAANKPKKVINGKNNC